MTVTLSVTRSHVARVLNTAALLLEAEGWDAHRNSAMTAIDRAAGYVPGSGVIDAEDTSLAAWEALSAHTNKDWDRHVNWLGQWEHQPGRTQADVLAALRAAAGAVTAP